MASEEQIQEVSARETRDVRSSSAAGLDEGDVGLIRWMLGLSAAERLQVLQSFVDGVTLLRNGRVTS